MVNRRKERPANLTFQPKSPTATVMMTILSVCIILITFILIQVIGIGASKDYLYNPDTKDGVEMEDVQPVIEYVSPKKMVGETDGDYK
jgi:hypothetical protein